VNERGSSAQIVSDRFDARVGSFFVPVRTAGPGLLWLEVWDDVFEEPVCWQPDPAILEKYLVRD